MLLPKAMMRLALLISLAGCNVAPGAADDPTPSGSGGASSVSTGGVDDLARRRRGGSSGSNSGGATVDARDLAPGSGGATVDARDLAGTGGASAPGTGGAPPNAPGTGGAPPSAPGTGGAPPPSPPSDNRPPAGNPSGTCAIPADAALESSTQPRTVVGTGTPASCTGDAFVAAVAAGGVITFDCGPDPVTITLTRTAKVFNDKGPKVVIDGGGKVTLSGGNRVRILYQNTCDPAQRWTTPRCDDQDHPQLTIQNLTLENGNARGETFDGGGGGAIFARGGRLKIINSRFFGNTCDEVGPDVGGAAVRVLSQWGGRPAYVVGSTFVGNSCSNGGGLSSIGVTTTVLNSVFADNRAIGTGANPARAGTPGGGSGGAIYNDGNRFALELCGTRVEDNQANEGGGAIFFVSNDRSGTLSLRDSQLRRNPSRGFETRGFPGIFFLGSGTPMVTSSTLE